MVLRGGISTWRGGAKSGRSCQEEKEQLMERSLRRCPEHSSGEKMKPQLSADWVGGSEDQGKRAQMKTTARWNPWTPLPCSPEREARSSAKRGVPADGRGPGTSAGAGAGLTRDVRWSKTTGGTEMEGLAPGAERRLCVCGAACPPPLPPSRLVAATGVPRRSPASYHCERPPPPLVSTPGEKHKPYSILVVGFLFFVLFVQFSSSGISSFFFFL